MVIFSKLAIFFKLTTENFMENRQNEARQLHFYNFWKVEAKCKKTRYKRQNWVKMVNLLRVEIGKKLLLKKFWSKLFSSFLPIFGSFEMGNVNPEKKSAFCSSKNLDFFIKVF